MEHRIRVFSLFCHLNLVFHTRHNRISSVRIQSVLYQLRLMKQAAFGKKNSHRSDLTCKTIKANSGTSNCTGRPRSPPSTSIGCYGHFKESQSECIHVDWVSCAVLQFNMVRSPSFHFVVPCTCRFEES